MENFNKPRDRRSITSPINGRLGGRPKSCLGDAHRKLRQAKIDKNETEIERLKRAIILRREMRLEEQAAARYIRPSRALAQIKHNKELRNQKMQELRRLRMVVRKLLAQLEDVRITDLPDPRTKTPNPYDPTPAEIRHITETNPIYPKPFTTF